MSHETSATRPRNLKEDDPVHMANYAGKGGGVCDEIKSRHFGALWNGLHDSTDTHMAGSGNVETNFRFTFKPRFVTCLRCREIMGTRTNTLQQMLVAAKGWEAGDVVTDDMMMAAVEMWVSSGCPGLKEAS